jgi:CHAD domain-containing protein
MTASRRSWPLHCRAALVEAILAAADQFPHPGADEADRIHGVRKALKAAAGLSRLFAPVVGEPASQALKAVNAARRRIGRARDLDILPGVLARLNGSNQAREILLRVIAEQREAERRSQRETDVGEVCAELRALAHAVEAWDAETLGAQPLLLSVRQAYRAARRLGHSALASRDAEDLHSLRVRVVDLSHQLAAFQPAWPDMVQATVRELHRLRKTLGDHNDLAVLAEFARGRSELPREEFDGLIALIEQRARPLERRAEEQFSRLFAERPGAFERRLAIYLERPQHKPGARNRSAKTALRDSAT